MSWITADSIRSKILTPQVLERRGFGDDGTPLVGNDKTFGNRISALAKQNTAAADREASEDTKNVRRRAIEIREKKTDGNRIGQIWIKMSPTDPRRTQIVNVRDELTNFSTDQPEIYEFLTTGNSNSLKTSYEITKGTGDPGPSGLQWINSNDSAKEGTEFTTELSNSALQDDILAKREAITEYDASADLSTHEFDFTAEEWAKYQIDNLTYDHFVEVTKNGIVYKYQPLQPKATKAHTINKYHIVDADVTEDYIEVPGTGTEYVLIGTEANDAEDISGLSGLNYGDWFSHNGYVWVLSRSTEDERQYQRDNEKNVRELRRRCIRIREKKTDGNRIGQIWIKMKENDPRRTTTVNIGSPLTLDATQDEPLIDVLKNNAGAFLSGHTYYGKFFVVDSKIDSEHNYIVRNSPTGFEYVFDEGPVSIHAGTTLKYGDFYQDGDDVWVVSRSTEDERQYQRDNEKNVRELRRRCIRIREKKTDGNKIGQIWIKMKENDPRRTNGVNVGTNITGTLNNGSYDDLVDVLKNEEDAFDSTHNYYGKYFVVDSKIDSEHNYVVRNSPTGFEYVFDEGNVPTIANLKYGDYYQSGDDVWVVSRSTEEEREYQRVIEKEVKELRRSCIRHRENSTTIGQIWVKEPADAVEIQGYKYVNKTSDLDAKLKAVFDNNSAVFATGHDYYRQFFVVDSHIDSEHDYVVRDSPSGITYVFNDMSMTELAKFNSGAVGEIVLDYGNYYQKAGEDYRFVVSRSTEVMREYMKSIEVSREAAREMYRLQEGISLLNNLEAWDPENRIGRIWIYVSNTTLPSTDKEITDSIYPGFPGSLMNGVSSGYSWYDAGASEPGTGTEITDTKLAAALALRQDFTPSEWNSFGITGLTNDHYILVGSNYYKPVPGKLIYTSEELDQYGLNTIDSTYWVRNTGTTAPRNLGYYIPSYHINQNYKNLQYPSNVLNNILGRVWLKVDKIPTGGNAYTSNSLKGELDNGTLSFTLDKLDELDIVSAYSSGLNWEKVNTLPSSGILFTDSDLKTLLEADGGNSITIDKSDWDNSVVDIGLTENHYIAAIIGGNNVYYKPVNKNTLNNTHYIVGATGYYVPGYWVNSTFKDAYYPLVDPV